MFTLYNFWKINLFRPFCVPWGTADTQLKVSSVSSSFGRRRGPLQTSKGCEGWIRLWVSRWLTRSICARRFHWQYGEGMITSGRGSLALDVPLPRTSSSLCERRSSIRPGFERFAPRCQLWCRPRWEIFFRVFLKLFSRSLWVHFPCCSSPRTSLGQPLVWHASYMTCPSNWTSVDAGQARKGKDPSVWNSVLPLDVEEFPTAGCVIVVQLNDMALVHCPCFTCVEHRGEYYCSVYLQLCVPLLFCFIPALM